MSSKYSINREKNAFYSLKLRGKKCSSNFYHAPLKVAMNIVLLLIFIINAYNYPCDDSGIAYDQNFQNLIVSGTLVLSH